MSRRLTKYNSEAVLHQQVVNYLKLQYPNVLFRTDFAAGIKMTPGQAVKHKKLQAGRAWPDLFIAEPAYKTFKYDWCGLFIELKKEGTKIYRRDGELVANEHIREQAEVLDRLQQLGYKAEFACGFEEAKQIIDEYLGGTNETNL